MSTGGSRVDDIYAFRGGREKNQKTDNGRSTDGRTNNYRVTANGWERKQIEIAGNEKEQPTKTPNTLVPRDSDMKEFFGPPPSFRILQFLINGIGS